MLYQTDTRGLTIEVNAADSFLDGNAYLTVRALKRPNPNNYAEECVRTAVVPLNARIITPNGTGGEIEHYMRKAAWLHQGYLNGYETIVPADKLGRRIVVGDVVQFRSGYFNADKPDEVSEVLDFIWSDNLDVPIRIKVKSAFSDYEIYLNPAQTLKIEKDGE